jgi:hypothetical protein
MEIIDTGAAEQRAVNRPPPADPVKIVPKL